MTNEAYAKEIAIQWNIPESGVGFVTKFSVSKKFMEKYQVHKVGGENHIDWCIPAEDLEELNDNIAGVIEVIREYK